MTETLKVIKSVLAFIVCVVYLNVLCYADNLVEDYCWRDYDGITPKDALQAGEDRNGAPIYIGQALFENAVVPGSIHVNKKEVEIEYNEAYKVDEAVKILCTSHPERFEWHKTRYDEVVKIEEEENKYLFEAGYEKDYRTYVGRVKAYGEIIVGKVVCYNTVCYKLTTVHNGEWEDHKEYEILTYNPDASSLAPTGHARRRAREPNNPTFLTYFFLVLVIAGLIVLVIVLLRRC